MKPRVKKHRRDWENEKALVFVSLCLISSTLLFGGCNQIEKPKTEPFYAQNAPPPKQEFRWSNGRMPKSFDPAQAGAPPETDVVRAVYEGLTDIDPKTLQPVPAIAVDWNSSDDDKTWTFRLRRDAKWSNGERVTAMDFVRSWKRLAEMGREVSHYELLGNIVGMRSVEKLVFPSDENSNSNIIFNQSANRDFRKFVPPVNSNAANKEEVKNQNSAEETQKPISEKKADEDTKNKEKKRFEFGVQAIDNFTLKVSLVKPDEDFPALVAHPLFRPIYGDGKVFESKNLSPDIVTNGAFRVFSIGQDGVTLERAENYWNVKAVELERVRFVPTESAEKALEAYRAGELDAVTNVEFEPLALKLLTPFDDFRRTTHAAINFYEFNLKKPPFNDRRVREAMAIAIERERLTEGEMEGASRPAFGFLPFEESENKIVQNGDRAKNLLAEAGFANGENFPTVKLLVNRNDVQQRVARSVAKMWKQNLNVKTEIVVKETNDLETAKQNGDFDLMRRGEVLSTSDETVNMLTIFSDQTEAEITAEKPLTDKTKTTKENTEKSVASLPVDKKTATEISKSDAPVDKNSGSENVADAENNEAILDEDDALFEMRAIPLYFPTSYSLVKPYVRGFEINALDAPSLKTVQIDNDWQPKKTSE